MIRFIMSFSFLPLIGDPVGIFTTFNPKCGTNKE